jgi:site-specific recombinase XerD
MLLKWKEADLALIEKKKEKDPSFTKEDQNISSVPVVHYRLKPVASLKRSWKTAKIRANITRRLRLYDLRHAFVTYALEAGADLKAVSEIAGHSRLDTTLRFYQHVLKDQHRQVVNKIPDVLGPDLVRSGLDQDQRAKI